MLKYSCPKMLGTKTYDHNKEIEMKKVLLGAILGFALLSLSGCGSSEPAAGTKCSGDKATSTKCSADKTAQSKCGGDKKAAAKCNAGKCGGK